MSVKEDKQQNTLSCICKYNGCVLCCRKGGHAFTDTNAGMLAHGSLVLSHRTWISEAWHFATTPTTQDYPTLYIVTGA